VLVLLSAAFVLCCSVATLAQNREKFVISAKAGGINAISGEASVHGRGETDWQRLSITDDLNAGDRVRTSFDGRIEILLNPGSYLRVGGNSEVELMDNTLENLEVRLLRGTAIVEAAGHDGLELNISISTPHTKLAIVRQGLYRVSVVPGDATELIVRKGRVILSDSHTKVKDGNKVVFSASNVLVAKLTKEEKKVLEKEEIDVWSKERAQTLARANRRISGRMLNTAFASYNDPFARGRFGLWFFNTRAGCYTFLPFYNGWRSPYGNDYWTSVYYPGSYYTPRSGPTRPGNTAGGSGSTTSGGSGNTSGSGGSGGSTNAGGGGSYRPPTPPPTSSPRGGYNDGMVRPSPRGIDSGAKAPRVARPNN
jgi:uncharacterized membrane protein YgcG